LSNYEDAAFSAEAALAGRDADPLRWFRWPSDKHRLIAKVMTSHRECYVRSPNQGAKTTTGAYIVTGMARGEKELDGEPLPILGTPNTGMVLVPSYKIAELSSVKALRQALGEWPHKVERGSQGTTLGFRVKPRGARSDDPDRWSRIVIHPEEGPLPTAVRLDWAWGDEPPLEAYWSQVRSRRRANRPYPRLITATPLDRARWEWLKREYTDKAYPGNEAMAEVKLALRDNRFLGPAHIRAMEMEFADDPLGDAILSGEYVDTTGQCPFDRQGLRQWEEQCFAGRKEQFSDFTVEVWNDPEEGEEYFVVCDLSAGIEDKRKLHDPAAALVIGRRSRKLVARWNGYRIAHDVGVLGAKLGEHYNHALLVPERNSGFGESFLAGAQSQNYGHIYVEHHVDKATGLISNRLGWTTSASNRGTVIASLQRAVKTQTFECHSQAVVDNLRTVIYQPLVNRVAAAEGFHDEDMICLGVGIHLLDALPLYGGPPAKPTLGQRLEKAFNRWQPLSQEADPFSLP